MRRLSDVFEITRGENSTPKRELKKGTVPLISAIGEENGIYGLFHITPKYRGVITVPSAGANACDGFYQEADCDATSDVLILKPRVPLTVGEIFFYILLIKKEKSRYNFGRKVSPARLGQTLIPDEIPEWVYRQTVPDFRSLPRKAVESETPALVTQEWKKFRITELFDVSLPKKTGGETVKKAGAGPFPHLTSRTSNNGVARYFDLYTEEGGVLVVENAFTGHCSYQKAPFSSNGHLGKLSPLFKMNKYTALFLSATINREGFRYCYGRAPGQSRIKNTVIRLPVKENGEPDWEFMENYIKTLEYSGSI